MFRQFGRVAIGSRGSGINHAPNAGRASRNQQVQGRIHATDVGGNRIGHRSGHGRQRSLVKHNLDARALLGANRWIGKVSLDKLHLLKADQVFPSAGDQVVDAPNGLTPGQKRRRNRAADKPGSSRNQILRQCVLQL